MSFVVSLVKSHFGSPSQTGSVSTENTPDLTLPMGRGSQGTWRLGRQPFLRGPWDRSMPGLRRSCPWVSGGHAKPSRSERGKVGGRGGGGGGVGGVGSTPFPPELLSVLPSASERESFSTLTGSQVLKDLSDFHSFIFPKNTSPAPTMCLALSQGWGNMVTTHGPGSMQLRV